MLYFWPAAQDLGYNIQSRNIELNLWKMADKHAEKFFSFKVSLLVPAV